MKTTENRQIDKKKTKQVRIDSYLHRHLKVEAAKQSMTIRAFVEVCLADPLGVYKGTYEGI